MFPPDERETTNNKGRTFLQVQHFLLMQEPEPFLIGRAFCSVTNSKCEGIVCVWERVFCRFSLPTWKTFRSIERLAWKTNTKHPYRASEVLQLSGVTCRPLQCVITISLYHPSRHILLSPCESWCPLSDGYKIVKCEIWQWDDTGTKQWRTYSPNPPPLPGWPASICCRHPSLLFLSPPLYDKDRSWQLHQEACVTASFIKHKGHEWAVTVMVYTQKHRLSFTGRHCDGANVTPHWYAWIQ